MNKITSIRSISSSLKKPATIDFFYDIISPYSWFAFESILKKRDSWNISVNLKPVLLPGITLATQNSPPMLVNSKAMYMMSDLERNARYFGVPLKMMEHMMLLEIFLSKGSLVPMRYLTALQATDEGKLIEASREMWIQIWNKSIDITEPDAISTAFRKAGVSEEVMNLCHELVKKKEIKDQLKSTTESAVDSGAFGVPTFVIRDHDGEDKMFFGSDRLHLLAQELGEKWDGPEADSIREIYKSKL